MKIKLLSSLIKVFKDEEPNYPALTHASMFRNERFSFQLALCPESESEEVAVIHLACSVSHCIGMYEAVNIPAGLTCFPDADNFFLDKSRKEYPDLLRPLTEGKAVLKAGEWTALWFILDPPERLTAGKKKLTLAVSSAGKAEERTLTLEIIDRLLPAQELLVTNWFHNDCLCTYYRVKPFSDRYWEIFAAYVKNAVTHGVNMILTPLFTPPLDTQIGGERPTVQLVGVKKNGKDYSFDFTNLKKYITICLENGVAAFEMSHLFTQWGAAFAPKVVADVNGKETKIFGWNTRGTGKAYISFLRALAPQLDSVLMELGVADKCRFHVSDEPSLSQINSYRRAAAVIRELFPDYNTFDALSDIAFYKKGLIKTPVPNVNHADAFAGDVEHFWTYYCCGQYRDGVPNRFFAMPSVRNRVLGMLLYQYNAEGFLQWGYNFWYTQYSKKKINPFKVTDAGGAFPAGDSFVVYPGEDGKPLNSLRFEVFASGINDLRALKLLESLSSREYALGVLNRGLDTPLRMSEYPHSSSWLIMKREEINEEIKFFLTNKSSGGKKK